MGAGHRAGAGTRPPRNTTGASEAVHFLSQVLSVQGASREGEGLPFPPAGQARAGRKEQSPEVVSGAPLGSSLNPC